MRPRPIRPADLRADGKNVKADDQRWLPSAKPFRRFDDIPHAIKAGAVGPGLLVLTSNSRLHRTYNCRWPHRVTCNAASLGAVLLVVTIVGSVAVVTIVVVLGRENGDAAARIGWITDFMRRR